MADLGIRRIKSARKRHKCNYCEMGYIEIGESYHRWTTVYCNVLYHVKQCKVCEKFAMEFPHDAQYCYNHEMMFSDIEEYASFAADYVLLEE